MIKNIQAIRGMNDLTPEQTAIWRPIEQQLQQQLQQFGYQEIRFPIVELTQLFKRSIGDVTDIVEKEMYTFTDRNGDSLSLRPEGTAGCVRAGIEQGLLYNQQQRLWYMGPMFRHERPQKGRYRQFHQLGVETYGFADVTIEAEIIQLTAQFWKKLGIHQQVELEINCIGSLADRTTYRQALVDYLTPLLTELDEDSQRRLQTNPLRILDSKNEQTQQLLTQAPNLLDFIHPEAKEQFVQLQTILTTWGITYRINPKLVRGLDYYNGLVFEWVTEALGAQGTVCAGGRYDNLVEQLGGKTTPAFGFAMGIERLVLLIQTLTEQIVTPVTTDLYILPESDLVFAQAGMVADTIRNFDPNLVVILHCGSGNHKKQLKKADKSGAKLAIFVTEADEKSQQITVKWLREDKPQQIMTVEELTKIL